LLPETESYLHCYQKLTVIYIVTRNWQLFTLLQETDSYLHCYQKLSYLHCYQKLTVI